MAKSPEERLADLTEAQRRDVYTLLLEGQADLQKRLQAAVDSGADGTARKLQQIQAEITKSLDTLDGSVKGWAKRSVKEIYQAALNVTDANMGRAIGGTVKGGSGFDAPIHVEALELLSQAAYQPFSDHLTKIGRRVQDDFQRAQVDKARGALLGVETGSSMERRLRATLQGQGHFDFTDRAGRTWDLKRYTEMVSRTILREAETQATANRLAQMGVKLGLVSSHNTRQGPCPKCGKYQDVLLSLDGNSVGDTVDGRLVMDTLEGARAGGLWHPNCRHNLLPWVPSIDDQIADLERRLGEGSVDVKKTPPPAPAPEPKQPKASDDDPIKAIKDEVKVMEGMKAQAEVDRKRLATVGDLKEDIERAHRELDTARRSASTAKERLDDLDRREKAGETVYSTTRDRLKATLDVQTNHAKHTEDLLNTKMAELKAIGHERDLAEVEVSSAKAKKKSLDNDLSSAKFDVEDAKARLNPSHYDHPRTEAEMKALKARIKKGEDRIAQVTDDRKVAAKAVKAADARLKAAPLTEVGNGWDPVQKQAQKIGRMIEAEAKPAMEAAQAKVQDAEDMRERANEEAKRIADELQNSDEGKAIRAAQAKRPNYEDFTNADGRLDNARYRKAVDEWDANLSTLRKAYVKKGDDLGLAEAQQRAKDAGKAIMDARREVVKPLWDVLDKVRPPATSADVDWDPITTTQAKDLANQHAIPFLPKSWVKGMGNIGFKIINGRCFYDGTMRINPNGHASLHETVHHAQKKVSGLGQAEIAFYNTRVTGPDGTMEPIRSLKTIYPGSSYKADEKARRDNFPNAYMGKVYKYGYYQMDEPQELLTCAIDDLSRGTEPWLYDPGQADLLHFTLGVLGGL